MWLNTNIDNQNIESGTTTSSWVECAELCKKNALCHASTWRTEKATKNPTTCRLKTDAYDKHKEDLANVITLPKDCASKFLPFVIGWCDKVPKSKVTN